jgi:mono/diheme cytochrome c family protein
MSGTVRTALGVTVSIACFGFGGVAAQDFDPVETGRALVTMYCADCHATAATGESPLAIAPRFRELHLRYDVEFLSEALVEGIVTAHPEMPQFEFDPDQAAAIVAYLKSLET